MTEKDWWYPKNLKKSEGIYSDIEDLDLLNTGNDFGSYKAMLKTNDVGKSQIKAHNNITPAYRVNFIKRLLDISEPKLVLDIGCGLGFTANELKQSFSGAKVIGIDISTDAVAFGKQHFPLCEFVAEAIDPDNFSKNYKADLICAFEFYPFTRTGNIEDHKSYLRHLLSWLSDDGRLVIFQLWDNNDSLSINYADLNSDLSDWKFDLYEVPIRIIGRVIPNQAIALYVSYLLRPIVQKLTGRKLGKNMCLILKKDSDLRLRTR